MLEELLTEEHVQILPSTANWKEAISLAAGPLVEDGSIDPVYVQAMIDGVDIYGPYIVLDDYFALPHAKAGAGVNRLGMSLLVVREEVDLRGSPVNIFLVLATVDSISHLDALAELSELLENKEHLQLLRTGTKEEILSLIRRQRPGRE